MLRKNQKFVPLGFGSWYIEDTTPLEEKIKDSEELLDRSLVHLSRYQFVSFFKVSFEGLINIPSCIEDKMKLDFHRRAANTFTTVLNDLTNQILQKNRIKSKDFILNDGKIGNESLILIFAKHLMADENDLGMMNTIQKILPEDQSTYPTVREFLKSWKQDSEQDNGLNEEINSDQLFKNIILLLSNTIKNAIIQNKIKIQEDHKNDSILGSDLPTTWGIQYILENDFFEDTLKQKLKKMVHQSLASLSPACYPFLRIYLAQPKELKKEHHNISTLSFYCKSNRQIHNTLIKMGFFNEHPLLKKESYRKACEENREAYREFIKLNIM